MGVREGFARGGFERSPSGSTNGKHGFSKLKCNFVSNFLFRIGTYFNSVNY